MNPRMSRNPLWTPLLLLVLLLPVAFALIYFDLATRAFRLLGLSPLGAYVLIVGSLAGSVVNIPLSRRRIVQQISPEREVASPLAWLFPIIYYYPPRVTDQIVAINVGGAIVPVVFSTYLLSRPDTSLAAAGAAVVIVAAVAWLFARPEPHVGITLPPFVAPLVAALAAYVLTRTLGGPGASPAPVAYIAGTLGTLIGADLFNLPAMLSGELLQPAEGEPWSQQVVLSIGGAGVFDGIFLTGILAVLVASVTGPRARAV